MKWAIIISLFLAFAARVQGQTPTIDYLQVDEAQSHLWIIGSFGNAQGTVTIEDTSLGIVSWSDTMIVCNLPDSGKGAGGSVLVNTMNGVSNRRELSIFHAIVSHSAWVWYGNSDTSYYFLLHKLVWYTTWRADIAARSDGKLTQIRFESGKSSFGELKEGDHGQVFSCRWSDTSVWKDTTIHFSGTIDLSKGRIYFATAKFYNYLTLYYDDTAYQPLSIGFDTTGSLSGYTDVNHAQDGQVKRTDSLFDQFILFPPSPKSYLTPRGLTSPSPLSIRNDLLNDKQQVSIVSEVALGNVAASLYSTDGRLLRRENIAMNSPGEYRFDVRGLGEHCGLLVVRAGEQVFSKKVLF